jgi:hypothetical protein
MFAHRSVGDMLLEAATAVTDGDGDATSRPPSIVSAM